MSISRCSAVKYARHSCAVENVQFLCILKGVILVYADENAEADAYAPNNVLAHYKAQP